VLVGEWHLTATNWTNRIVGEGVKPADQFLANPQNWRRHPKAQREALRAVLDEIGWVQRVIENVRTGHLIDGHERVWNALQAGNQEVPYIQVDVSEEEERLLLATLDPISAMAETDKAKHDELVQEITTENEVLQDFLGLQAKQVEEVVEPELDLAGQLLEQWGVEPGQVWEVGKHKLLVGDCTDWPAVEALFGGERAQMAMTSPPYGIGKEYEEGASFSDLVALIDKAAEIGARLIKPGGYFVVNFGNIYPKRVVQEITGDPEYGVFLMSTIYDEQFRKHGWKLWANRIWRKPFFGVLGTPYWSFDTTIPHHKEWEYIWTFRAPGGENQEPEELIIRRVPASSGELTQDEKEAQQWMGYIWRALSGAPADGYDFMWTFRLPGKKERKLSYRKWRMSLHAIWDTRDDFEPAVLKSHCAAFVLELPRRAIEVYSHRGDVIWEPFLGSGTTLLACEQLQRRCIATEREPRYVAVALERFEQSGLEPRLRD